MKNKKKIILIPLFLLVAIFIFIVRDNYKLAEIGAGYIAKNLCSEIFVTGRNAEEILRDDLKYPLLKYFSQEIDNENKSVTVSIAFGLVSQTAYFREGLGVTLNLNEEQRTKKLELLEGKFNRQELEKYEAFPELIDSVKLVNVVNQAFTDLDTNRQRLTRAIFIVHNDTILIEKYAEGFSRNIQFCGWSMTKSVTNAMIGLLVKDGHVSINDKLPIKEWKEDERRDITYNHLLKMTSGLEFEESYKDFTSDVMMMLYASQDAAAYAYNKPLINEPGTNCYYSSGNTNILTYAFKKTLLDKGIDHKIYPYENLFYKLGMKSVILEYDASDTFLGSTGMYATALDWALFGMLYLNDGIWNDERILPAEWVKYSTTRNPDSRKGKHSAHFWVKSVLEKDHENYKYMIKLPDDIFYAAGHYGQYVTVIPSYNLVIVRLGFTKVPDDWNQFEFLLNILNCFKDHAI